MKELNIATYFNGDEQDWTLFVADKDQSYGELIKLAVKTIQNDIDDKSQGNWWSKNWSQTVKVYAQTNVWNVDGKKYNMVLEEAQNG